MGIVFSHTIAILLLSARRRLRGVSYTRQQNCFISSRDKISEDAIAKISEADNFNELRKAISESVSSIWSSVCSVVYIADSQDLYLKEHRQEAIPHTGIARECLESKEVRNCSNCSSDPIFKALSQHNHFHHDKTSYVSCIPIVDHVSSSVIGVVAIGSIYELSNFDSFDSIKDQIVGCYRRLCKCQRGNSYTPANPSLQNSVSLNGPSDPRDALLRLCGDLYDQDATVLQHKINRFLEEQTNSDCAFHLLVVPETDDLICQVVGSRILQEEVTFPGQNSIFSTALETKKPISLQDTPLDKRKDIEDFLGFTVKSLLCVPVICKNHEGLLALACVTNKDNSDRFSNEDIQIILQCFQYTSTILRSTLAFQNERKLKLQTQAMLQVARNLFTHLGEFSFDHSNILDNYPNLAEFLQMYKEQVPMQSRRKIRSNPYKNSNGSARIEKRNEPIDLLSQQETLANKLSGIEDEVVNKGHSHYVVHPVLKSQAHKSGIGYFDNSKLYQEMDDYKIKSKDPLIGSQKVSLLEDNDTKQIMTDSLNLDELDISTEESPGKSDVPDLGSSFEEQKDATLEIDELKESEGLPIHEDDSTAVGKGLLDVGCVDEAMSQRSYKTALSEDDKTMMYSAIDDTGISECDGENLGSEEYTLSEHYYTDLTTSDLSKVSRTMSETENLDDTGMTDVPVHRRVSDKDFDQPEVRLSNSAPSLSHVNEGSISTILSTDNIESKPELNYAFLSDSLLSNVDNKLDEAVDEEAENCRSRIILGFDDVIQGSRIDIVVEDTDTDDRVTLSMHKVSTTMPGNVSRVSEVKHPCGSFEETRQKDYKIVKDYHPPSYDDDIITFDDLTKLLREIMQEARNLTQAERCSVFLIDKETDELVAKVFDGITTNDSEEQTEIRMPSTRGIAGHVATTGTLLNIKDAYSHPLFFRGIDDSTGFKTRNILCFPIKNEKGDVLGVAQLCNKKNGPYFTTFDEEVASAFAVYCCISISHSLMYQNVIAAQIRNNLANELMMYHMKCLMYKKLQLSQHRNRLTNELMIYHMQVSYEDVLAHVQNEIPPTVKWSPDFDKFPYPPREIPENDTTLACLTMFEDLGFITRWRIKKETLIRFTLMVKKGYRNPPYHNWMHAFAVAHFCYLCIKNLNLTEYLDDLEMFALFVSCLGHDIDHRGTNNQYQVASKSVLAALYSSEGSVMERHHFAQTMCIVNTEGCNIFENLPSKDYTAVLDLVRDIILATDLAHHLKILGNLKEMASEGYDKTNIKHHKMLLCLLMTASDLSDQTKPWDFTKHVAALIYREFFSQGDLEKALGQRPIEMMDRERARIPDLQIGFLDHIALPVYRVLGDIFPSAESVTNTVVDNRRHWEKICALIKIRRGGSCEQMSYDQILALEEEEADAEIESYQLKQQQAEQNGR